MPLAHVAETVRAEPEAIREINHRGRDPVAGRPHPCGRRRRAARHRAPRATPRRFYVVMAAGGKRRALLVDRLVGPPGRGGEGARSGARAARRGLGHHDPGRRPGGLHPGRGPHSRRRPTCRLRNAQRADGLLGFADAMEARAAGRGRAGARPRAPPADLRARPRGVRHPGDPGARGHPGLRDHPGAPGAGARARGRQPARAHPRRRRAALAAGAAARGADPALPGGGGGGPRPGARPPGGRGIAGDQGARRRAWSPRRTRSSRPTSDYLTGVARWHSRLIILLDLEKALLPTE